MHSETLGHEGFSFAAIVPLVIVALRKPFMERNDGDKRILIQYCSRNAFLKQFDMKIHEALFPFFKLKHVRDNGLVFVQGEEACFSSSEFYTVKFQAYVR